MTDTQIVDVSELMGGKYTPVAAPEQETVDNKDGQEDNNNSDSPDNPIATPEVDDHLVLEYLKSKGIEADSIDTLAKPKEVDPYEGVLDDEERSFLNFKKETGGTREDFDFQNKNWDEASTAELVRLKVAREAGLNLSDEEISEYLDGTLGIDIDDEDMSVADRVKLNSFLKEIKSDLKKNQADFNNKYKAQVPEAENEIVELDNGIKMSRKVYEEQLKNHQKFTDRNKEAVNSVTDFQFGLKANDNGVEKTLNYSFDVSEVDRQSMLAITDDVSKYVQDNYGSKDGFKNKEFNADFFWINPKNRERVVSSLLNQARAGAIEELMKLRGNVNLSPHTQINSTDPKEGTKIVPIQELFNQ